MGLLERKDDSDEVMEQTGFLRRRRVAIWGFVLPYLVGLSLTLAFKSIVVANGAMVFLAHSVAWMAAGGAP